MKSYIMTLLCDFYKISHKNQYPKGTTKIYSTLTPRTLKYAFAHGVDRVVVAGLQGFIRNYLFKQFKEEFFNRDIEEIIKEHTYYVKGSLGGDVDTSHLRELHEYGRLPITIKTIPEGQSVLAGVPVLTIENTDPRFFWLTNYLETIISCSTWQAMTSASIAREYYIHGKAFAEETVGNCNHLPYQFHDFSMRGLSSLESSQLSGLGHLVFFKGTDSIPAITYVKNFYETEDTNPIGDSIPATEHSVMSSHGVDDVETLYKLITDIYPQGPVSVVSDTYDFWNVIEKLSEPKLYNAILNRNGTLVIRPDSGDPVEVLTGKAWLLENKDQLDELVENIESYFDNGELEGYIDENNRVLVRVTDEWLSSEGLIGYYKVEVKRNSRVIPYDEFISFEERGLVESLWHIFGGKQTNKSYFELDRHIRTIYGDSITIDRAKRILSRLKMMHFASSNVVFGVGSYTYQYNTRDTLGFAVKSTYAEINGESKFIFKDPKTDKTKMKKSQKGMVKVIENGNICVDSLLPDSDFSDDLLKPLMIDGELIHDNFKSFEEIRESALEEVENLFS